MLLFDSKGLFVIDIEEIANENCKQNEWNQIWKEKVTLRYWKKTERKQQQTDILRISIITIHVLQGIDRSKIVC